MKVVITGANGQLGQALQQSLVGHEVIASTFSELDITNRSDVMNYIQPLKPDILINAAAYTQVDQAESDIEAAFQVNEKGPQYLAQAAHEVGAAIVQISTDYVFDGASKTVWSESDETHPLSVYGKSKLAGELAVKQANPVHFIVRTAWLYHYSGQNFLRTMYGLADRDEIRVVNDQRGSPTNADHLAIAIGQLIETRAYGTHHLVNSGEASWYELTREFYAQLGIQTPVIPVSTDEFPRPAPRPASSVLVSEQHTGIEMPTWQSGLSALVQQIKQSGW